MLWEGTERLGPSIWKVIHLVHLGQDPETIPSHKSGSCKPQCALAAEAQNWDGKERKKISTFHRESKEQLA